MLDKNETRFFFTGCLLQHKLVLVGNLATLATDLFR